MHDAAAVGFSRRRRGIIGMTRCIPGGPPAMPAVATATRATLHHSEETVTVEKIRPATGGSFIGTISGFEHSHNQRYARMKVGDDITFEEAHVFTVGD